MRCRFPHVLVAAACAVLLSSSLAFAADGPAATPPVSPQESLKQIEVDPGLKVELVANEPNIMSPVAMRFDEDGRLWVVQMCDYPTGATKDAPQRSRISILRDKDGDGFYETATVFADNLSFATGIQPWKGGVFVTMAGKVAYMKDTDGDDKADINETWYTGFAQLNEQLRANHPTLALDNHIYIAGGLRGGTIVDAQHPNVKPVSLSGRDFRFDPLTHKFEAITGEAQFGLTFDDYGNRFVCANRDPAIHSVLEDHDIKKNPLVTVDAVMEHVIFGANYTPVFPIGRAWTTSNLHAGQFTAACGIFDYRGDALPADYYGDIFTCEPTGYLVHHESIKPNGVTFAESFEKHSHEFFASRDEWCRPVNLEVGPDGAMYVVDMYRQIIEHPEWMPEELRHRPNLRAGWDKGRIYRITSTDFHRPAGPKLGEMSSEALVGELANPNSWTRETAARLLLERQDKSIGSLLRTTALENKSPLARIQALRLLEGLGLLDDELLLKLYDDSNPRIVERAVMAADSRVANSEKLRARIAQLVESKDPRVRFEALLVAQPLPTPPKYAADKWEEDAMLIATGNRGGTALQKMLASTYAVQANVTDPARFINRLARLAAASSDDHEHSIAVEALLSNAEFGRPGLTGFLSESIRRGSSLAKLRQKLDEGTGQKLDDEFASAGIDAVAADAKEEVRCEAVDLLAFAGNASEVLLPLAAEDANQNVRLRAIAALAKNDDLEPWKRLLADFSRDTPVVQRALLDSILPSPKRTSLLLDTIEAGKLKPTVIDPIHAKLLLAQKNPAIKDRAAKLMASAVPADREKVLAEYRPALDLKADTRHGGAVFEKRCSICHKINNVGVSFAPDISDSRERSPVQLLTDIIEPNRAIDSNFFSYSAITNDGHVHTGVLAAETSTSITLKQQEGKSETIRRDEIEELHNDGVSYMPEGLEKDIPPQDMADLISYIKNWRYLNEAGPAALAPATKP
ncbi:MAG TPA: PVC-type heme-binding CxxCH protein [Lacipirellulaceae bacterium]|nr:PVC-type heme-binding CxxCH protein [Lacipirellulaceae bacterium]